MVLLENITLDNSKFITWDTVSRATLVEIRYELLIKKLLGLPVEIKLNNFGRGAIGFKFNSISASVGDFDTLE